MNARQVIRQNIATGRDGQHQRVVIGLCQLRVGHSGVARAKIDLGLFGNTLSNETADALSTANRSVLDEQYLDGCRDTRRTSG
jgi:hypothetical protein